MLLDEDPVQQRRPARAREPGEHRHRDPGIGTRRGGAGRGYGVGETQRLGLAGIRGGEVAGQGSVGGHLRSRHRRVGRIGQRDRSAVGRVVFRATASVEHPVTIVV
jgi:hypothetical protein